MTSVPKMLLRLGNATLACVLAACVSAAGQVPAMSAAQSGTQPARLRVEVLVVDENGVAVPNARLTAAETHSGRVRVGETDAAGRLRLLLDPGLYRFTVDRTGFYTLTTPEVNPSA